MPLEPAQQEFLRSVLDANPTLESNRILRHREHFLETDPTLVVAELADPDGTSEQTSYQDQRLLLQQLQHDFYQLNAEQRERGLQQLITSRFADIATQANRMSVVAQELPLLQQVSQNPGMNPHFFKAFCRVLVAAPAEANQIREEQLGWMRPEQNEAFTHAFNAIRPSARLLSTHLPKVYELEQSWLDEILSFDPKLEIEDEQANQFIGWIIILAFVVLVFAWSHTIKWLFS